MISVGDNRPRLVGRWRIGRQHDLLFSWSNCNSGTGHVMADQIDYLRRCGFTHAAIKPAHHPHWQQAHQAICHHFQHMPDSPRSWRE